MEFEKVLVKRVSTRKYNDKIPSDEDIQKILDAALFWDVGTIIENMELQATALGLAHCGINTTVVAMRGRPDVRKALDIPEGFDALASVIISYTDLKIMERKVKLELIPVSYVK